MDQRLGPCAHIRGDEKLQLQLHRKAIIWPTFGSALPNLNT